MGAGGPPGGSGLGAACGLGVAITLCGAVWCGVVFYGVLCCGVLCCGVLWCGVMASFWLWAVPGSGPLALWPPCRGGWGWGGNSPNFVLFPISDCVPYPLVLELSVVPNCYVTCDS